MKKAILATKIGMTQIFNADGVLVPVTVLEAGPCVVTQIKTVENDGYSAVQVGFGDKKEKVVEKDANGKKSVAHRHGVNKAQMGHFKKAGVSGKRFVREFKFENADEYNLADEIKADIFKYMGILEEQTGKKFGDIENPLLVSVRSGARQSMPGMMDTILNLGLNDQAVEGLAKKTSNPRFAYDCYRRFIQMYSDVVMELGKSFFEERIDAMKERKGVKQDIELDAEDLKELVKEFKAIYLEKQGEEPCS